MPSAAAGHDSPKHVPDNVSAAAVALAVNQAGAATVKTVVLITPEDMDKAGKKTVDYRAPGR